MEQTDRERIVSTLIDILKDEVHGLRTAELTNRMKTKLPDVRWYDTVLQYAREPDSLVYQPSRGWFRHKQFQDKSDGAELQVLPGEKIAEEKFYKPFADWLERDLGECTKAICVGGARLKDKWGTPDVVGILRPRFDDIVKFPIEITSAEIKVSSTALITAFGQACSYKLFSHKSYIAVPRDAFQEDIDRLESLCMIVGIGLIVFDSGAPESPNFQIRTRAIIHNPDMYYVNDKIRHIAGELFGDERDST